MAETQVPFVALKLLAWPDLISICASKQHMQTKIPARENC